MRAQHNLAMCLRCYSLNRSLRHAEYLQMVFSSPRLKCKYHDVRSSQSFSLIGSSTSTCSSQTESFAEADVDHYSQPDIESFSARRRNGRIELACPEDFVGHIPFSAKESQQHRAWVQQRKTWNSEQYLFHTCCILLSSTMRDW